MTTSAAFIPQTYIFGQEQLSSLNKERIPRHLAIIPDGNRRWAQRQQENNISGYHSGANTVIETVKAAKEIGIKTVSFYLFSTENWNRPKEEIAALIWLLQEFLIGQTPEMLAHGVRLKTIGDLNAFSDDVVHLIHKTQETTAHCSGIDMVFALNYGSRDEIRRACCKIIEDIDCNRLQKQDITESLIGTYLDTAPWGDPDLLIRTSGEMRLSNFLLWQLSYAEIYTSNLFWPDFMPSDLLEAVLEFQKRERRWGSA